MMNEMLENFWVEIVVHPSSLSRLAKTTSLATYLLVVVVWLENVLRVRMVFLHLLYVS